MNTWEKIDEVLLPNKDEFYSSLNMEEITMLIICMQVFKICNNKNIGDYHDLYVQSDTLLLADIFENFRNKCIEIYELDPAHFYLQFFYLLIPHFLRRNVSCNT